MKQGQLLKDVDVAKIFALNLGTLRNYRTRNVGPAYYKLNGQVRYDPEDVKDWFESSRVVPGEQGGQK